MMTANTIPTTYRLMCRISMNTSQLNISRLLAGLQQGYGDGSPRYLDIYCITALTLNGVSDGGGQPVQFGVGQWRREASTVLRDIE